MAVIFNPNVQVAVAPYPLEVEKSSPELLQFYLEWLVWAESGDEILFDNHDVFGARFGLCMNLMDWLNINVDEDSDIRQEVANELAQQFVDAGLDPGYPFGYDDYQYEQSSGTMHLNAARLAWVKARIKDAIPDSKF